MPAKNRHLLEKTRLGILITNGLDGSPVGVPVWFDWNGEQLRCFSAKHHDKIKRLEANPAASLLVTNNVGEPEAWLAFDGTMEIKKEGGIELAEKLASVYWDLSDERYRSVLDAWKRHSDAFVLLEMTPSRIRAGG